MGVTLSINHPDHLYLTNNYVVTHNTYLAVAKAAEYFDNNRVNKILLLRPAVATEDLGYLPGTFEQKIDPYLRPLFDALEMRWDAKKIKKLLDNDQIEVAALAYIRGRTFNDCFVILDEAQNTTKAQMKLFLTRLGEGIKCVVTGDLDQSDLATENGLTWACEKLKECQSVKIVKFESNDVVRSRLIQDLLRYI